MLIAALATLARTKFSPKLVDIEKEVYVHTYNGILFSHQKVESHYYMDELSHRKTNITLK